MVIILKSNKNKMNKDLKRSQAFLRKIKRAKKAQEKIQNQT